MQIDENDPIRYDQWIEDALRSVIRKALTYTAENGLVGDHHFYITFRTNSDLVSIPPHMLTQHPEEMTIVLQHQFNNLQVNDDGFSVTLRFNGRAENLSIPFSELTGFSDPSVNFGLQLKTTEMNEADIEDLEFPVEPPDKDQEFAEPYGEQSSAGTSEDSNAPEEIKTGEVIALDAFRKK